MLWSNEWFLKIQCIHDYYCSHEWYCACIQEKSIGRLALLLARLMHWKNVLEYIKEYKCKVWEKYIYEQWEKVTKG